MSESDDREKVVAEVVSLRQSIDRLNAVLPDKILSIDNRLPFTKSCEAVLDRYEAKGSAAIALEAWPYGKTHFYDYMRRCPELKAKWQAIRESLFSKRAAQRRTSSG